MSLKRPLTEDKDAFPSPRGPKRRHILDSSLPPSSPFATSSSLFATPRKPYAWIVPSDSPTNPFGRIRRLTQCSTLPGRTPFSRHLALRFQLVRPDRDATANGRNVNRDGVYRIMQVPLSYTLGHLRKLLAYSFHPSAEEGVIVPYNFRRSSTRLSGRISDVLKTPSVDAYSPDKGKEKESSIPREPGHLFEVHRRVVMHPKGRNIGEIKEAKTWIKSSRTRDPFHYPVNTSHLSEDTLWEDNEEGQDWRWEAEEDFTLGQAWPNGVDASRAITYHHNSSTQIHITINTKKVQKRKGVGNKPFTFQAYGSVDLDAPDDTLRLGMIDTLRWNKIGGFERFLKAEAEKERVSRQDDEEGTEEDAEGDFDPDMSSATLPMLFSSPGSFGAITPFPTEPMHRRRVHYEHSRILKLTRKNMKDAMKDAGLSDEEEVKEPEVDELDDDQYDASSEQPSDWDPFREEGDV
ncbi:hypothetical protein BJ138DRAFT_1127723 [Hygrophoropsis aurantiaca]|uniref:Uncharacterized protein n=1 Tax=Hygrophoropsis aurantiaca TaxID=72124 RepID=A0ACB8A7J8_9AGAM|nr:hypothetical protein BJ138DRAFT_1127723 [Hygrophoropsis aurantiaca]